MIDKPALTQFREAWAREQHGLFLWLCMSRRMRRAMEAVAGMADEGVEPIGCPTPGACSCIPGALVKARCPRCHTHFFANAIGDARNEVIANLERDLDHTNEHYDFALARLDKIEKAIRDLPRLDHDFCIDYNVKHGQKRYDDRPWDELAEDHREWHRLRTARAMELLRTALNSGSQEAK